MTIHLTYTFNDGEKNIRGLIIDEGVNDSYNCVTFANIISDTFVNSTLFQNICQISYYDYIPTSSRDTSGYVYQISWNCPRLLPSSISHQSIETDLVFSNGNHNSKIIPKFTFILQLNSPDFFYTHNSLKTYSIQVKGFQNTIFIAHPFKSNISYFSLANSNYFSNYGLYIDTSTGSLNYYSSSNIYNSELNSILYISAFNDKYTTVNSYPILITSHNSFNFFYNSIAFVYGFEPFYPIKPVFIFDDIKYNNITTIKHHFVNNCLQFSIHNSYNLGFHFNTQTGVISGINSIYYYNCQFTITIEYIYNSNFVYNSYLLTINTQHTPPSKQLLEHVNNHKLNSLNVEGTVLTPTFHPNILNYSGVMPYNPLDVNTDIYIHCSASHEVTISGDNGDNGSFNMRENHDFHIHTEHSHCSHLYTIHLYPNSLITYPEYLDLIHYQFDRNDQRQVLIKFK